MCLETSCFRSVSHKQHTLQVTSVDLHRHFHAFNAGVIEDVRVQRDKGFGFVRYSNHAEAARAIQIGNARILFGKPIKVTYLIPIFGDCVRLCFNIYIVIQSRYKSVVSSYCWFYCALHCNEIQFIQVFP